MIKWLDKGRLPSGSRFWESRDGLFRLVASEHCHGVELPLIWKLWIWRRSMWHPLAEGGRKRVEKIARKRAEQMDSED